MIPEYHNVFVFEISKNVCLFIVNSH